MKIIKFLFLLVVLNFVALTFVNFGLLDMASFQIDLIGAVDGVAFKSLIPIIGVIPLFIFISYMVYLYLRGNDLNKKIWEKFVLVIVLLFVILSWLPVIFTLFWIDLNVSNPSNSLILETISLIWIVLSVLFVFIGYRVENIKPNHFIGIKTPWTLKNEVIWKKTHKLASYTFMIAGFVLLVYGLATFISVNIIYSFMGLLIAIFLLAIVPIVYSYYEFNKL